MSLTDTINNTNKQKENVKIVATEIDNKLVELGGERATDLADVVNKMEGMVNTQYVKIAYGESSDGFRIINRHGNGQPFEQFFEIPINLNFEPKRIIVSFEKTGDYTRTYVTSYIHGFSLDSKYHTQQNPAFIGLSNNVDSSKAKNNNIIFINSISKTKIVIGSYGEYSDNSYVSGGYREVLAPIKWIAIG